MASSQPRKKIMEHFCTQLDLPERKHLGKIHQQPELRRSLLDHLRSSVFAITTDAAADEMLASKMGATLSAHRLANLTPNLQFIMFDKAHASRRVTASPWASDSYLQDVLLNMCRGSGSPARMIQNSTHLRREFQKFVAEGVDQPLRRAASNFRAAMHRFESFQKPLGRSCLYFRASIQTMLHCSRRADMSGKRARDWLLWINEERLMSAAMLSDASDEAIVLTRLLDQEDTDPAMLQREVGAFLTRVGSLFDGGKVTQVFGYTSTMLASLRSPMVYEIAGQLRTLGDARGVQGDVIERCLDRMRCWLVLARATIKAKFPSFELAQVRSGMQ